MEMDQDMELDQDMEMIEVYNHFKSLREKFFTQSTNFQGNAAAVLLKEHEMRVNFIEAEKQKLNGSIEPIAKINGNVKLMLEPLVKIRCQNNNGREKVCNKSFSNEKEFEVHIKKSLLHKLLSLLDQS